MIHQYDVVIIGSGGAGLRAAVEIKPPYSCAVLSKVHPLRSHTGAAQGGISAALGNEEDDSWEWHAYDTVKGSDYLGDQDSIEIMCQDAIRAIIELEHMGMPFSRRSDGKIAQRNFGGHTRPQDPSDPNSPRIPVKRACYSADRTGHVMLHTLFENAIKNNVTFFSEFYVTDLIVNQGAVVGVIALDLRTTEIHIFHAKAVLFATGGYGRIYQITSNAHAGTGDGFAIAYRRGIPLQDMEFVQFHPTGLYKLGILISEAARGEGGILRNVNGERFMERYAPTVKDLAPRDMVSRAMMTEIREGRGIPAPDGSFYIGLDLTHLGEDVITKKLPEITGFARTYLGVEPTKEWIPVQPTCHYAMGGIPTNNDGQVVIDEQNTPIRGFYAAGEIACVSVHGANRLGTNSLLDLIVFGRRAGKAIFEFLESGADYLPLPKDAAEWTKEQVATFLSRSNGERPAIIRKELQKAMMEHASVFRTEHSLKTMLQILDDIKERYNRVAIDDKGRCFNTDLIEVLELRNLIETAETVVHSALNRTESRGAHYREDYPNRDDTNWLKHTLISKGETDKHPTITYKPVRITKYQPMERKY